MTQSRRALWVFTIAVLAIVAVLLVVVRYKDSQRIGAMNDISEQAPAIRASIFEIKSEMEAHIKSAKTDGATTTEHVWNAYKELLGTLAKVDALLVTADVHGADDKHGLIKTNP